MFLAFMSASKCHFEFAGPERCQKTDAEYRAGV